MNTSRKLLIAGAAALAATAMSSAAFAQASQTANGTASVTVLTPLTVANGAAGNVLALGTVVRGAGTATVDSTNGSPGGSLTKIPSSTSSRAEFVFTGEGGQNVNITVPASVTLKDKGGTGTNSLTVSLTDNLSGSDAAANGSAVSTKFGGSIGAPGTVDVGIGGSLTLVGTEATGAYQGSFTVTAAYE